MTRAAIAALLSIGLAPMSAQTIRVMNAASFYSQGGIAPGSIVSVFGENLTNTTTAATDPNAPPKSLAGVTLTIGGVPSGLFFVSPRQVNGVVDSSLQPGSVPVVLQSPTGTFSATVTLTASAPGVFSLKGTGTRDAAVINAVTFATGPFTVTTNGAPTYLAIYATGLDLSATPSVTIGGVSVPVQFSGNAPCCKGLQQINVQLTPALAGAGRVEIALTAGGKTSNITEVVILPSPGQGPFGPTAENEARSREIASLAYIPNTSLLLLGDENDDVLRVIDARQGKVVNTIVLPQNSEPAGIAVNAAGTLAVVSERELGRVALIDLSQNAVSKEVAVGGGPGAVAIAQNLAVILNQDSDSVSILDLVARTVTKTVGVGRGPRGVAIAPDGTRAFVTNQDEGTVSVVNLGSGAVDKTFTLGSNARPAAIVLIPAFSNFALITDPSANANGRALILNLTSGATTGLDGINPDRSGGVSDVVAVASTVYLASQTGGSVIILPLNLNGSTLSGTPSGIKVDLGARALAVDTKDNLLLVSNEGSGTVVAINLATNQVASRLNGVRSQDEAENDNHDNHGDREKGANAPVIVSLSPNTAAAGTTFTLTITGTNLGTASSIVFLDPSSILGGGKGRGKGEDNGHGLSDKPDPAFTVSNIQVNTAGTQVTASVAIAAGAPKGDRIVRVATANGESTSMKSSADTFTVN